MTVDLGPNVYDFRDPIRYLEAVYQFEHASAVTLSLTKWALNLGFRTPDSLVEIMKGKKKISSSIIELLAQGLNWENAERTYFEAMVKFSLAQTLQEKNVLELVLSELTQLKGSRAIIEDMNIFSHWVHMAILSMTKIPGVVCTRKMIRHCLTEEVSEETINVAVDRLKRASLLEENEDGVLSQVHDHATTRNDAFTFSPHDYFSQVSDLAKVGSKLPAEEREFQCFTIAISEDQLPAFKTAFRNFRSKIGTLAEEHPSDRVFQCNLQLFPLTKKIRPSSQVTEFSQGAESKPGASF